MKINPYTQAQATHFERELAKGIAARVVIGKSDGANNFCMRVFEIAPGGHTPKHSHAWEHEMFIHAGEGEVYGNGRWKPMKPGTWSSSRPMKNIRCKIPARSCSWWFV